MFIESTNAQCTAPNVVSNYMTRMTWRWCLFRPIWWHMMDKWCMDSILLKKCYFQKLCWISKNTKKNRSDKEGRRHKWHILRHLIERTSKHQNNFNSLWILIQIFFCVSFLLCIVAFFLFLYNVGLTLERMSVEWPLREIFGFGYFYRNEFFLSISKTS